MSPLHNSQQWRSSAATIGAMHVFLWIFTSHGAKMSLVPCVAQPALMCWGTSAAGEFPVGSFRILSEPWGVPTGSDTTRLVYIAETPNVPENLILPLAWLTHAL